MAGPTREETLRFFDAIAPRYDRVYGSAGHETRRRMAEVLARLPASPADVLDLGVGTGRELPALLDAGHRVTGMDLAPRMLAEHGRRARRVPLVTGDFYDALPFEDASFDAVLALFGALAHPPDPTAHARLATEVARVLRPGGVFLAEVPSPEWLARLPDRPGSGDLDVWRVGPREAVHDDRVARVSLVVVVPTREEWLEALSPLDPTIEDAGNELHLFGRAR